MKDLNEHEIEVALKTHELFDKFIEDLLDVLDGERLSYTVATLLAIAQEIIEVTEDIEQSHGRKEWVEKMVEKCLGKPPLILPVVAEKWPFLFQLFPSKNRGFDFEKIEFPEKILYVRARARVRVTATHHTQNWGGQFDSVLIDNISY